MKVKEMIELLKTKDQEMIVLIDGYEDGLTENIIIEENKIVKNINKEWYYGEHEIYDTHNHYEKSNETCMALCIRRMGKDNL